MGTTLPRITARVDDETQDLLTQATAIAGMSSINSFVLSAAVEKAKQIMAQEQMLKLSKQDAMLLTDALDQSAQPNPTLKSAIARYQGKVEQ